QSRQELEDLTKLMTAKPEAGKPDAEKQVAPGDVTWLLVRTYALPNPGEMLERGVAAARDFAAKFPKHPHSVDAAWLVAQTYANAGRSDEAIAALQDFIDGK